MAAQPQEQLLLLRLQMGHLSHLALESMTVLPGLQGQCLHAVGLRFLHPRTGEMVELSCPLPEEFERQLKKYRGMT